MKAKLYTAPAAEPVSLSDAKLHLRVDSAADDTLITALVVAAREHVEQFTRRALITQTWDAYLDEWPEENFMRLPFPPLQSVTDIRYTDSDGVEHVMSASDYDADTVSIMGRIVLKSGKSWPSGALATSNPIKVRFVAGYGATGAAVPASVIAALKLLIGNLYEHRSEAVVGNIVNELPFAVESLLWSHRVMEF